MSYNEIHLQEIERIRKSYQKEVFWSLLLITALFGLIFISSCNDHAYAYTDEQYVNAIYKAEGGLHAKKPYGILSIPCSNQEDCRRICLRTVKNNRIRYSRYVRRDVEAFVPYLSRVYAPIGAGNDLQGLNKNWVRNVEYFLKKEA